MFFRLKVMTACLILLLPATAIANGPPIHGETAFVTGLNGAAFRTFGKFIQKSGKPGEISVYTTPLILPYELLENRLVVGAGVPFLNKTLTLPDGTKRSSGYGAGDLLLFAKYNLYQKDRHQETLRIAGKISLSLPTGRDDLTDGKGLLPPGLQLGTGTVNPGALVVVTKLWRRFGINGDVGYTFMPENNGLDRGDVFQFDLAASYRLLPVVYKIFPAHQFNLMLELNGTYTGSSTNNGIENLNSGGTVIFASPGLQYIYSNFIAEISVQIPIVKSLYGNQLKPDYTSLFGIRWLIF